MQEPQLNLDQYLERIEFHLSLEVCMFYVALDRLRQFQSNQNLYEAFDTSNKGDVEFERILWTSQECNSIFLNSSRSCGSIEVTFNHIEESRFT